MNANLKIAVGLFVAFAALIAVSWRLNLVTADWFTAIATLLLAITAFFTIIRDELRRWIRGPEKAPRIPAPIRIETRDHNRRAPPEL
jgi:ABC-type nickel/cobalt efflux system permease component RcnA